MIKNPKTRKKVYFIYTTCGSYFPEMTFWVQRVLEKNHRLFNLMYSVYVLIFKQPVFPGVNMSQLGHSANATTKRASLFFLTDFFHAAPFTYQRNFACVLLMFDQKQDIAVNVVSNRVWCLHFIPNLDIFLEAFKTNKTIKHCL